jgi:hypothetical protein
MLLRAARMTLAMDRPTGAQLRPAGGALMAGRAVRWFTCAVVPLALLGFGLYLALGDVPLRSLGLGQAEPSQQERRGGDSHETGPSDAVGVHV